MAGSPGLAMLSPGPLRDEPIQPVPQAVDDQPARSALGRRLFSDVRLSGNGKVACMSCHDLRTSGADPRGRSIGFAGVATAVSTPTIFNAALNFRQFWNGRAESLEAQVEEVVRSPVEMGSAWPQVVDRVRADANYRRDFAVAFSDGVTQANIEGAIAAFERTQLTPDARFDRYLRGDSAALTDAEKAGYAAFKRFGCIACHQGVNVGGNMFQRFGVMGDFFAQRGHETDADQGRFLSTHDESDRHVFKVPSLRNVEFGAPYFHDGSAKTLPDAVDVMFRYQLGRTATATDKASIIAFLLTLSGRHPAMP